MKTHKLSENCRFGTVTSNHAALWRKPLARMAGTARRLLLLATLVVSGWGTSANAVSVFSIVANPGEDASTQIHIGWHALSGTTNSRVLFTKKSDVRWRRAVSVFGHHEHCDLFDGIPSKTAAGADFTETAVFANCGAILTNLAPDTEYMYKVCGDDGSCSPIRCFKTAGAEEFSFIWISDIHVYAPLPSRLRNAVRVIRAAQAMDPSVDFIFSTGDVLAWGGSYSFWQTLFEQDFIKNHLFANVLGNHDAMTRTGYKSPEYFRVAHHFPRNGYPGQEGVSYWFLYGKVLFLVFNTEALNNNPAEQAMAQRWAAGVIQRLKGKYRHIFLAQHYHWFDVRGKTGWYAHWKDFCDEHKVALALSGHNHVYQRTHPLHQDQAVAAGQGTVFMGAPAADGDRGVKAGPLDHNAEKLAYTYSSDVISGNDQVKTIGCVLVQVKAAGIATRLVYLDENQEARVADEHTAPVLIAP